MPYQSSEREVSASISWAKIEFTRVEAVITLRHASDAGVTLICTESMPVTLGNVVA